MNDSDRRKRERRNKRRLFIKNRAEELRSNLPRSEKWFANLYTTFKSSSDEFNVPFAGLIPDVINHTFKYVIEVDGSIHDLDEVKRRDLKKDRKFKSLKYEVIRVVHNDLNSFNNAMSKISKLRGPYYKPCKIYTKQEILDFQSKAQDVIGAGPDKLADLGGSLRRQATD